MLKAKDLRDLSLEELELQVREAIRAQFDMLNQSRIEKLEKPHLLREKRRDIARLHTVIREKQVLETK